MRAVSAGLPADADPALTAESDGESGRAGPPAAFVLPATTHVAAPPVGASVMSLPADRLCRQVADAVLRMKGDRIEIALSPEELGSVRLVLSRGESGAAMTVWVERPEVLEMLRRNAETMLADLRNSGFGEASLSFRDGSDGRGAWDSRDDGRPAQVVGMATGIGASDAKDMTARVLYGGRDRGRLDIRV